VKWLRVVERGNRQILLTTEKESETGGYLVIIETHFQGDQFVSLAIEGFESRPSAYAGMMGLSDDEIMANITNVLDALSDTGDSE
jgi:hypothetical protein